MRGRVHAVGIEELRLMAAAISRGQCTCKKVRENPA
jgi:hypothetical protein